MGTNTIVMKWSNIDAKQRGRDIVAALTATDDGLAEIAQPPNELYGEATDSGGRGSGIGVFRSVP
jgi:hypothetical protein